MLTLTHRPSPTQGTEIYLFDEDFEVIGGSLAGTRIPLASVQVSDLYESFAADFAALIPASFEKQVQIEVLRSLYFFREPLQVKQFLLEHAFLIPILFELYPRAAKYFGGTLFISLEVIADGESSAESQIFAYVQTTARLEEGLARLKRFDDEWWLDAMRFAHGRLVVDLEFQ